MKDNCCLTFWLSLQETSTWSMDTTKDLCTSHNSQTSGSERGVDRVEQKPSIPQQLERSVGWCGYQNP